MASYKTRLNYDELNLISKQLQHESNDIVHLHSVTRQKLQALRGEWNGRAAEAFLNEMETRLLPAVQRTARALSTSETVLNQIMNTIHEADLETAGYFKGFADAVGGNTLPSRPAMPDLSWLRGVKVDGFWGKNDVNFGELLKGNPALEIKIGKEGQLFDGGNYKIGRWDAGLKLGQSENGFSAGFYGEYDAFKSETTHVSGSSIFGFTETETYKAGSVGGFVGIKDNSLGYKIGGSVASIEKAWGINIAGFNIGVKGGLLLGGVEYGAQIGTDTGASFGPFKLGLSFGESLTDSAIGQ